MKGDDDLTNGNEMVSHNGNQLQKRLDQTDEENEDNLLMFANSRTVIEL
jgi:hypothetical protein